MHGLAEKPSSHQRNVKCTETKTEGNLYLQEAWCNVGSFLRTNELREPEGGSSLRSEPEGPFHEKLSHYFKSHVLVCQWYG